MVVGTSGEFLGKCKKRQEPNPRSSACRYPDARFSPSETENKLERKKESTVASEGTILISNFIGGQFAINTIQYPLSLYVWSHANFPSFGTTQQSPLIKPAAVREVKILSGPYPSDPYTCTEVIRLSSARASSWGPLVVRSTYGWRVSEVLFPRVAEREAT